MAEVSKLRVLTCPPDGRRGVGWKRIVAPIAAIALLGPGCATTTVQSSHQTDYSAGQPRGLTYFLPMRQARLTLTRMPADPGELIEKRDEKVVALAAASAQAVAAKARREQAEAMLAALSPNAASRPDQIKLVELAVAQESVLTAAAQALRLSVEDLSRRIVTAQAAGGECRYTAKIELLPVQADPRARFVADLSHSNFRDDTVRLDVSPAGLLSSANVVAVDQTGQILVELAGLAGSLTGTTRGLMADEQTAVPGCVGVPVLVQVFDPMNRADEELVNQHLQTAEFPFRIRVTPRGHALDDGRDRRLPANGATVSGIYYRSPTPVVMELRNTSAGTPVDAVVMMLPQAGPVSWLPMEASPFVKTTSDVQFADGSISSWSSDRPSEVLSVARLPAQAIDTFASALARILTIRVETSNSREALDAQQVEEIAARVNLQLYQACLTHAGSDTTAAAACSPETE